MIHAEIKALVSVLNIAAATAATIFALTFLTFPFTPVSFWQLPYKPKETLS